MYDEIKFTGAKDLTIIENQVILDRDLSNNAKILYVYIEAQRDGLLKENRERTLWHTQLTKSEFWGAVYELVDYGLYNFE